MFVNAFPLIFSSFFALYLLQASGSLVFLKNNITLFDQQAAFGPPLHEDGLTGQLLLVGRSIPGDQYGCTRINELNIPKTNTESSNLNNQVGSNNNSKLHVNSDNPSKWIAMVKRGNCSFATKVKNMQDSGASAVIVADPVYDSPIIMYSPDPNPGIDVYSTFITRQVYRTVVSEFENNSDPIIVLLKPNNSSDPSLTEILFIFKVFTWVFFILTIFCFWFRSYQSRSRDLAPSVLVSGFPTHEFFLAKTVSGNDTKCPICLEDYADNDELRTLPCRHEFHITCIDRWLTSCKKYCPICKANVCPPTESTSLLPTSRNDGA